MHTYAILKNPGYTRVSFQHSDGLIAGELALAALKLSTPCENIRHTHIGGIPYVLFDRRVPIGKNDLTLLSRLSFTYAIFELQGNLLRPIEINPDFFLDKELSGILKYSGKTNELFTRLMINVATFHIKNASTTLNILDPLAGKGTTLLEALMQGHNAYGIEIEPKPPQESMTYLKKYLETARYKHTSHTEKISGVSDYGKFTSTRYQLQIARDKEAERRGNVRQFEIIAGDARNAQYFYKKNQFHAIIADLPYGVQHSSTDSHRKNHSFTRNAFGLISEAMLGWTKVLKPGGTIVLAWNLFLIPRAQIAQLMASHGLIIPENADAINFAHRVDQAIDRDLIVGIKML